MKKILLLWLCLPVTVVAQSGASRPLSLSVGLGTFRYQTNWYYYRYDGVPSRYNYPVHRLNRAMIVVQADKVLWKWGPLDAGLYGEALIGLAGKTTGEWLPGEETISSGGISGALGAGLKVAYSIKTGTDFTISPSFGLGPQFTVLYCDGKGLGPQFASKTYYHYDEGWTEYLVQLNGSLGCSLGWSAFEIIPELRFSTFGTSFTNWQPNEEGVDIEKSPGMLAFAVRFRKKFK